MVKFPWCLCLFPSLWEKYCCFLADVKVAPHLGVKEEIVREARKRKSYGVPNSLKEQEGLGAVSFILFLIFLEFGPKDEVLSAACRQEGSCADF